MPVEIEAKLKVDSLKEIAEKLDALGAEFGQERLHLDSYFDDANTTFRKSDRCLRLRRQSADNSKRFFLTYKGAKEKDQFKKRQEVEVEVEDGDSAEKLLLLLGYNKVLVFEKKRQIWRFGGCEVALDELPLLGSFVEIEGPDEQKIADVQSNLGLSDLPVILESYASLMAKKLLQLGRKEKEVLL
ncbi:MAG: class IV adenylate cyclase [Phycisphaerae bacterium]|nr:class IV adenylate cyclase [Phycisphaerae bacterium]